MTLSDTQLMILSSASQRADHAAILPANLKGSAAKKVIDRLLKQKLLQELRATDDTPVWRRGEDNQPYSLRLTKAGLNAIEVDETSQAPGADAEPDNKDIAATDLPAESKRSARPARAKRPARKKTALVRAKATKASFGRINSGSKQDKILALLQRPNGATLDLLVKETEWQKHSVRGFLAGTVRKKLQLPLLSEKIDGIRTYRIGSARSTKAGKKRRSA